MTHPASPKTDIQRSAVARGRFSRRRTFVPSAVPSAVATALCVLLAFAPQPAAAQPGSGPGPTSPDDPRDAARMISRWTPEYGTPLVLPMGDGAFSLALGGDALWVATETMVSRLDRGVWLEPKPLPEGARAFALTVAGSTEWAFGYEGGVWRRGDDGEWRAMPRPTGADLLAAAHRGASDVWAAGYDYPAERGVLVHYDGNALHEITWDALRYHQFTALAVDERGTLWAGGCGVDGETGAPLLLRLPQGATEWEEVPAPLAIGCIYHLAFTPEEPLPAGFPRGVAAGGTDLLTWDGVVWEAMGRPPEADPHAAVSGDDVRWMRVGLGIDELGTGSAWAVAGVPTWRGYSSPQTPWRLVGGSWEPGAIDDLGLIATYGGAGAPSPIPPLDMVSDGRRIWAMGQVRDETSPLVGIATMIRLDGTGARLAHPLVLEPADVAIEEAGSTTRVHLGGRRSGPPLMNDDGGGEAWPAPTGFRFAPAIGARMLVDVVAPGVGWALQTGRAPDSPDRGEDGALAAWRLIDDAWIPTQAPTDTLQLRALPDGGAWARAARGGELIAFDGSTWSGVADAPRLSTAESDCRRVLGGARCQTLVAPFDVVPGDDGPVGWVGGDDGRMYRWDGTRFDPVRGSERGEVIDLQLVSPEAGWAIARHTGGGSGRSQGVLMRLEGRRWSEVRTLPLASPRGRVFDVEWHLLAAVDEREAWTAGTGRIADREVPMLVRWLDGGIPTVFFECLVGGITAHATTDGVEVWLVGAGTERSCRPNAGRRTAVHITPGRAERPFWPTLSRISMTRLEGTVYLPSLHGFRAPD